MSELFHEAFRLVNFPFTALLIVVVGYWLLVGVGALSAEHGDASADIGHDLDGDGDLDADDHVEAYHGANHSPFAPVFKFVNLGDVPVMIVLSILILAMWMFSMIANRYWTGGSNTLALAFLGLNLVVSAVVTRYVTLPLKPLFRALRKQHDKTVVLVGSHCTVSSLEADGAFGQAEVKTDGAPLLINVRVLNDATLKRGDLAVIVREDRENRIFFITANPLPEHKQ